jgi:hypothetical protein
MKKLKIPVAISISFLLIFIQTGGFFYSKSYSHFSYAGLIILGAFFY